MTQFAQTTKIVDPAEADVVLAIDLANIAYRAYFGNQDLATKDGRPSGHIYGVIKSIIYCLQAVPGKKVALTFCHEGKGATQRRRDVVETYKANRDKDRFNPLPDVAELVKNVPGLHLKTPLHEGDDMLCWVATKSNKPVVIYSGDKDIWHCLRYPNVSVYSPNYNRFVTQEDVLEHFFVNNPAKIPLVKAIFGDASDGIKGVFRLLKKHVTPILNREACVDVDTFFELCMNGDVPIKSVEKIAIDFERLKKNLEIIKPYSEGSPEWQYVTPHEDNKEKLKQALVSWDCVTLEKDVDVLYGQGIYLQTNN